MCKENVTPFLTGTAYGLSEVELPSSVLSKVVECSFDSIAKVQNYKWSCQ